jgi:hypothetical protein
LDDGSDMSSLCREYPKLPEQYQSLVAKVNTPCGGAKDNAATNAKMMRRRDVMTELKACVEEIEAIHSHERFLLGQTIDQMQESIGDGCVIIVDISAIRSGAIFMTGESLQAIQLLNLNVGDAIKWLGTEWKSKKRHELRKKNDVFLEYLAWLWRVCVGKILDHVSEITKGQEFTPVGRWKTLLAV